MKLKLAELADLCLAQLYDLTQAEGQDNTQPIDEIVYKFKTNDSVAAKKVAYYLQSKGYVAVYGSGFSDSTEVCITPFGITTVKAGGETGLVAQYRQDPEGFLKSHLSRNN